MVLDGIDSKIQFTDKYIYIKRLGKPLLPLWYFVLWHDIERKNICKFKKTIYKKYSVDITLSHLLLHIVSYVFCILSQRHNSSSHSSIIIFIHNKLVTCEPEDVSINKFHECLLKCWICYRLFKKAVYMFKGYICTDKYV